MRTGYVYDIECLGNTHTATFLDITTEEIKVFVINHLQDDRKEYFDFLFWSKENAAYLGFNNVGYDYPVLHKIIQQRSKLERLNADECAVTIKKISDSIIESERAAVWDKEVMIPQVDLYKIKHYDGKAKTTSLKMLEFVMRMENIEEMPFEHTYLIQTADELKLLIDYNVYDVQATKQFYVKACKSDIELRAVLSKEYGINLMNASEPKMSKDIFGKVMSQKMQMDIKDYKQLRTKREHIDFIDAIPSFINFESKELQALLVYFKKQRITELKGAFDKLNAKDCEDILPYVNKETIKKAKGKSKDVIIDHLNVVYNGNTYFIGGTAAAFISNYN